MRVVMRLRRKRSRLGVEHVDSICNATAPEAVARKIDLTHSWAQILSTVAVNNQMVFADKSFAIYVCLGSSHLSLVEYMQLEPPNSLVTCQKPILETPPLCILE